MALLGVLNDAGLAELTVRVECSSYYLHQWASQQEANGR